MSQVNRNLVADALESGEFEQGTRALCRDGKHCCLGVACEIYQRVVGGLEIEKIGNIIVYSMKSATLPGKVKEWLGFVDCTGSFYGASLVALNDHGMPFTEIAKLFRNPPKGLINESSES